MNSVKQSRVSKTINYLSLCLVVFAIYTMLSPFVPKLTYALFRPGVDSYGRKEEVKAITSAPLRGEERKGVTRIPFVVGNKSEINKLTIGKIGVDGEIREGDNRDLLKLGIWHLPWTSSPEKGGNTVIVAHRFLKTSGPETFYHLDELKKDDIFSLKWKGTVYEYRVYETLVVPPSALEIEQNTVDPIVTLYTCTPLWSSTERLVVRAKLLP